jgi:hypothetical protein
LGALDYSYRCNVRSRQKSVWVSATKRELVSFRCLGEFICDVQELSVDVETIAGKVLIVQLFVLAYKAKRYIINKVLYFINLFV